MQGADVFPCLAIRIMQGMSGGLLGAWNPKWWAIGGHSPVVGGPLKTLSPLFVAFRGEGFPPCRALMHSPCL